MKEDHNGEVAALKRRLLDTAQPVLVIANAMVTLALSGGGIVWAITQERADQRHDTEIAAVVQRMTLEVTTLSRRIDRNEGDIKDNRNDIARSLERINDHLNKINERLAALKGTTH